MPPAAISRSSTYLPKICGNIATIHVSAAALLLLPSCGAQGAAELALPVQVHALESCPVPTPARIELTALGDFPISNITTESLALDADHKKLAFPVATLALEASAVGDASPRTYIGYSERRADRLDVLLWPRGSVCSVYQGSAYPGKQGGEAIGYAASSGIALLAGSDESTRSSVVGALAFDVRTGESRVLDPLRSLTEPRAYATVTEYGSKLLVAGGENPIHDAQHPATVLRDTAEVYDPANHAFEPSLVRLVEGTTRHAAITLEGGETLLIGGRNAGSAASNFIQIVSPTTGASKLAGTLRVGRESPTALRLSDGRLFIAGGEDAAGKPIGTLEWRGADGSELDPPSNGEPELPARFDRAFAALPGGAVLAVGGCEDRPPAANEDCSLWCRRGCPPRANRTQDAAYDAFWITPEGSVIALDLALSAGDPVLLPGSDGRPWLIANDSDALGLPRAKTRALYRFDPWTQSFSREEVSLPDRASGNAGRFIATGTDAFVWFDDEDAGPTLRGLRLGTRSAFANDVSQLTLRDPDDETRPAHLAPDHPPGAELNYDSVAASLRLARVSSEAACAWLTDAEYADFTAKIVVSTAVLPTLRVGERVLSADASEAATCELPKLSDAASGSTIELERRGTRVTARIAAAQTECALSAGRVTLAVCGSTLGDAQITALSVLRGAP